MAARSVQIKMVYRRGHHRRGGARPGAGRKPKNGKAGVSHLRRPRIGKNTVLHVTMRVVPEIGRLRKRKQYQAIRRSLHVANARGEIRIIQFSVQGNHYHLIVEADSKPALSRGMHGLNISIGRRLNKLAGDRKGKVFVDRYHSRIIKTPTQARNTLCYVLQNARRHGEQGTMDPNWVDPYSSGKYFDGWKHTRYAAEPPDDERVVRRPRSWLLSTGWRKRGLISVREVPG